MKFLSRFQKLYCDRPTVRSWRSYGMKLVR